MCSQHSQGARCLAHELVVLAAGQQCGRQPGAQHRDVPRCATHHPSSPARRRAPGACAGRGQSRSRFRVRSMSSLILASMSSMVAERDASWRWLPSSSGSLRPSRKPAAGPRAHPPVCCRRRSGRRRRRRRSSRAVCRESGLNRRARTEMACRLNGWIGSGRCPHWLIGGNNGTANVWAATGPGSRHTWRLAEVTTGAFLNRRRTPAALVPVTSASTIRRHRTSAHGPHSTASATASMTCISPEESVTPATPSTIPAARPSSRPTPGRKDRAMRPRQVVLCRGGRTGRRSSRGTGAVAAPSRPGPGLAVLEAAAPGSRFLDLLRRVMPRGRRRGGGARSQSTGGAGWPARPGRRW